MCILFDDIDANEIIQEIIDSKKNKILTPIYNKRINGEFNLKHRIIRTPIQFKNCIFTNKVDLRYCECEQLVSFVDCIFEKEVNSGDKIESHSIYHKDLIFNKSHFKDLAHFNGIICEGSGYFHNSIFEKEVDFGHAFFKVHLECNEAIFQEKANFNSLEAQDCIFIGAKFFAKVIFNLANINGDLVLNSAIIEGEEEVEFNSLKCDAFLFNKATINIKNKISFKYLKSKYFCFGQEYQKQNVQKYKKYNMCAKFINFGFCNCEIFNIIGSELKSEEKIDFSSSHFKVVSFYGNNFQSEVDFKFTNIDARIELKNTYFDQPASFYNSNIKQIILGDNFPFTDKLNLRGLTFEIFEGGKKHWKKFVEAQQPDKFSRDPYIQIEKYFHKIGDEVKSTEVYFEGRSELRKYALNQKIEDITWSRKRKLWDWFLKHLTGYGVQTERLFIPIIVFVGIGTCVFWDNNFLNQIDNKKTNLSHSFVRVSEIPEEIIDNNLSRNIFKKLGYSVDLFIPVLDLQIANKLELSESAPLWKQYYRVFHIFAGWFLIPLLIASISGIIRRDNN